MTQFEKLVKKSCLPQTNQKLKIVNLLKFNKFNILAVLHLILMYLNH
jgi:hypothetical protein